MVNWANSRDPILQRYGVGGVARAAVSNAEGLAAVADTGGLKALVVALSEDDPQAQCFAAAALGQQCSLCCSTACSSLLIGMLTYASMPFIGDFALHQVYYNCCLSM